MAWFLQPFWDKIKGLVRPTTAETRRTELVVKHALPVECFQQIFSALQEGDAEGVSRDSETGMLVPTGSTATIQKFNYMIRKGSVADKIFNLSALDVAPPEPARKPQKTPPDSVAPGDEPDVYEVESIVGKRTVNGRVQYEVKWQGWDASTNTWEARARIHPDLVKAYEGKPPRPPRQQPSSSAVPFCANA
eukprot:3265061-Prymnesium_polylepis.1